MRPKRARSRNPAKMANSRWVAYGIASTATALGATTAEAEIHYSGIINVLLEFAHSERTFPLSNSAVLWFEHYQTTTDYTWAFFELRSAAVSNGWQQVEPWPDHHVPKNLAPNRPVSHGHFGDGLGILATSPSCFGYQFCERGFAILGFKFNTGGWHPVRVGSPQDEGRCPSEKRLLCGRLCLGRCRRAHQDRTNPFSLAGTGSGFSFRFPWSSCSRQGWPGAVARPALVICNM